MALVRVFEHRDKPATDSSKVGDRIPDAAVHALASSVTSWRVKCDIFRGSHPGRSSMKQADWIALGVAVPTPFVYPTRCPCGCGSKIRGGILEHRDDGTLRVVYHC